MKQYFVMPVKSPKPGKSLKSGCIIFLTVCAGNKHEETLKHLNKILVKTCGQLKIVILNSWNLRSRAVNIDSNNIFGRLPPPTPSLEPYGDPNLLRNRQHQNHRIQGVTSHYTSLLPENTRVSEKNLFERVLCSETPCTKITPHAVITIMFLSVPNLTFKV